MNEQTFRAIIRQTPANHTETAPDCDATCARWGGLAHAHICPDGLYNNDHPFLDLTAWCSCGVRIGEPVHLDARQMRETTRRSNAAGRRFVRIFETHMAVAHGINIRTDPVWLERLAIAPENDGLPPPKMRRVERAGLAGVECLDCGRVSVNPGDVQNVYCGNCKRYGVLVP